MDLSLVDGVRELTIDGEPTIRPIAVLEALSGEQGNVALHAERVDDDIFAVDVFPF